MHAAFAWHTQLHVTEGPDTKLKSCVRFKIPWLFDKDFRFQMGFNGFQKCFRMQRSSSRVIIRPIIDGFGQIETNGDRIHAKVLLI